MSSSATFDAIVVGGGHNGLVAGFYLARRGLRTVVLERRAIVGGACVTEEFAPGYRASPAAYVLSMLRAPVRRDLRLVERGLRVDAAGPSLTVFPDGSSFSLSGNRAEATAEIHRLSPADARAFPRYEDRLGRIANALMPLFDRPPPESRGGGFEALGELAVLARLAFRHRRDLADAAYLFASPAGRYLDERFHSELLKAALGWESISNTLAGPSTHGTAYNLLHDAAAGGSGGGVGWGFVRGGMGTVTQLMAAAAQDAGAEIRTSAPVERILVERGRAVGVELEGGRELRARVVVSNADPKQTFLRLVGEAELPAEFVSAIGAYRCEGTSLKINLAVGELPRLAGSNGTTVHPYHRGLIQVTKPLAELDADQALARAGVPAPAAHLELCIPSVHDPSLAPAGRHVVTIGVRSQPYRLAERGWDEIKESVADRVIANLGGVLPNLPASVLHRQVLSPLDLERVLALTGGHSLHGDMAPDQIWLFRPVRGYSDYRTPVRALYLCGAGTHPGGGVSGANGRNCARAVLRDVGGSGKR